MALSLIKHDPVGEIIGALQSPTSHDASLLRCRQISDRVTSGQEAAPLRELEPEEGVGQVCCLGE